MNNVLEIIAQAPKGEERASLLANDNIRSKVLNSGANVTIYTGDINKNAKNSFDAIRDIYVGLILRKNKKGQFDGLGALGGLAERTLKDDFNKLSKDERQEILGKKDDVILENGEILLIDNIDIICKNNVLRELREELFDLGIDDIFIDKDKLELVKMPNLKDDNYMINIWDGKGECFAVNPYCFIYKDDEGIIDKISKQGKERLGGEVNQYCKIHLFEALKCFGNKTNTEFVLEDGRDARKDYRYPHEYLVAWCIAGKLLGNDEKFMGLALSVQENVEHRISFKEIAKNTKQSFQDVATSLNIDEHTLMCIESALYKVYKQKKNKSFLNTVKNYFYNGI